MLDGMGRTHDQVQLGALGLVDSNRERGTRKGKKKRTPGETKEKKVLSSTQFNSGIVSL